MAVLNDLKNVDARYSNLANKIKELTNRKTDLINEIIDVNNKTTTLNASISDNLIKAVMLQAASKDLDHGSFSPQTISVISSIEKLSFERLLEYNYYLAKSYEYRMLEPYPGRINFEKEFKDMLKLVDEGYYFITAK